MNLASSLLKAHLYIVFGSLHTVVTSPSVMEDADDQEDKQGEILLNVIRPDYERPPPPPPMEPLYSVKEDGKVRGIPLV